MSFRSSVRLAVCFVGLGIANPAIAEYAVRAGDVLEIDVAGMSSLRQKLPVAVDGTVRIQLIGAVAVAGRTLDQITKTIQERLASKTLHQTSPTGQSYQVFFEPEQIQIFISEYRPIYVSGDVARPGQQTYRPGMTIRQVVALSGGYDIVRNRNADPLQQVADLSAEINTLRVETARDELQVQRIRTELTGETTLVFAPLNVSIQPELRANLERLEHERFLASMADLSSDKTYLSSTIQRTTAQSETLNEQLMREKEGLTAEVQEGDRLMELAKKGTATSARVFEARRSILFASARYLQTVAQVTQLKKDQADLHRQFERLGGARRAALLKELQEAMVRTEVASAKIRSAQEKLDLATGARRLLAQRDKLPPNLVVVRQADGKARQIRADEDTVLMPGDVVEVALSMPGGRLPLVTE